MSAAFYAAVGWDDGSACLDLPPEVRWIEPAVEDHFVDLAKLGERKDSWQELECDIGVANLVAQPPERILKNLVVIEGELFWHLLDRKPTRFTLTARRINGLAGDEGVVGYGDSVFARVAVRFSKSVELLQVCCLETGL